MPTSVPDRATIGSPTLGTAMGHLRHRWAWFIVIGALAVLLGVTALVLVVHATIATVYTIAVFMIIAGGAEIAVELAAKTWERFFLWIVAGLFYVVAGAFAIAQPIPAAVVLTLMLGVSLLAAGATRIFIGSHMVAHARSMMMFSGVVTALVGLLVIFGWPTNSVVILGTLLGVDLLFTGISWIGFGLRLRTHA